jgi:hypothetical protein
MLPADRQRTLLNMSEAVDSNLPSVLDIVGSSSDGN